MELSRKKEDFGDWVILQKLSVRGRMVESV